MYALAGCAGGRRALADFLSSSLARRVRGVAVGMSFARAAHCVVSVLLLFVAACIEHGDVPVWIQSPPPYTSCRVGACGV